jgi:hypothetical protein
VRLSELHNSPTTDELDFLTFEVFYEEAKAKDEETCAIERFQHIWQEIRKQGGTKESQLEKLVDALDDACENRSYETQEIVPKDDKEVEVYCSLPGNSGAAVICTASAKFLQKIVGGKVMGYMMEDNPGTSLEEFADSHDFLLVDNRYIVDYWVKKIEGVADRAVLDLQRHADKKIARKMYGLKSNWGLVEGVIREQVELDQDDNDGDVDPNWEEKIYKQMPDEYKKQRRLNRKMREADKRLRDKREAKLKKELGAVKGDRVTLTSPKIVYHGSPADNVKKIMADGFLKSNEVEKVSSGGMEENGLIWFSTAKIYADQYARGYERGKGPKHGAVFSVVLQSGTKLIDRYARLTEREAEILNKGNKRRSYDPIRTGDTLSRAMNKLYQHPQSVRTYGEVLPLLGYHGLIYGQGFQIGMAHDKIPIEKVDFVEPEES